MSTKLKEAVITKSQSMVLMKNMIRISISSICHHRDIFPQECFAVRPYGSMKIVQLEPASADDEGEINVKHDKAFLLTQWLEHGVFDALEKEFISALVFGVNGTHPVTGKDILLETYEFKFTFESETTTASINGNPMTSKDDIKTQAGKFIRNLVTFSGSLEDLPRENWITLQIKYSDKAPSEYCPAYFADAKDNLVSFDGAHCLKVKLGGIQTPQMQTSAKFTGLEPLFYRNIFKRGDLSTHTEIYTADENSMFVAAVHSQEQRNEQDQLNEKIANLAVSEDKSISTLNEVKSFVTSHKKAVIKEVSNTLGLETARVKEVFTQLVEDGTLKLKGKGYLVVESTPPTTQSNMPQEAPGAPKKELQYQRSFEGKKSRSALRDIDADRSITMTCENEETYEAKGKKRILETEESDPPLSQSSDISSSVLRQAKYGRTQPMHCVRTWIDEI